MYVPVYATGCVLIYTQAVDAPPSPPKAQDKHDKQKHSRHEIWTFPLKPVYTTEKLGPNPWKIIIQDGSDKKWAEDQVQRVAFTLHIMGFAPIIVSLWYCACDQRNHYTS